MYDLFNQPPINSLDMFTNDPNEFADINGLKYIKDFVTSDQEKLLIKTINGESWSTDIKRRVQHYGYRYDYKSRSLDYSMYLGDLPHWASKVANRFFNENYIDYKPDQLIVNEYLPGQGIANHVDCTPCFGDTIISLSLGAACVMDFKNINTRAERSILLERRSAIILAGDARYLWTHGINARKVDEFKGYKFERGTRLSMTFRKVLLKN